jgi:uncharacterized protein DUF1553/uncharacterized protein DUF1549/cytochrome c/concanavalin A-like lectin/glucanase superfamily protein
VLVQPVTHLGNPVPHSRPGSWAYGCLFFALFLSGCFLGLSAPIEVRGEETIGSAATGSVSTGSVSTNPAANESAGIAAESTDEAVVDYIRDIRPILSDRCYACHGPDAEQREAELRLDQRDSAFGEAASGEVVIVPGQPDASELLRRLAAEDPDEVMPPADSGEPLAAETIALVRRWIEQGAPWQSHWALLTPELPDLPEVSDPGWPNGPIDTFILARLDREKLKPSRESSKETLLRRVTFDLTGLPPTLEEIDQFLADESADAYQHAVEKLLQSPRYGEHMARYWLDAARYGDTHGLHLDNYREMWPYRDWVVRAFNDNMPYDRFTIEQLAGDLLPDPSLEQLVATGFNRCHVSTNEGGSIEEEVYVRNVVDRVVTTGTVFLGLTFECTRCHDHKYDPLTMRDFYSMFAIFNNLDGPAMDGNVHDTRPIVSVPSDQQQAQLQRLEAQLKQLVAGKKKHLEQAELDFDKWHQQAAIGRMAVQEKVPASAGDRSPEASAVSTGSAAAFGLPEEGLIGHYSLDLKQDGTVANIVAGSQPGKAHGPVKAVPGHHGTACALAADAYLELGNIFGFQQDQRFSLGAWVQLPKDASGAILSKTSGNRRGYALTARDGRIVINLTNRADGYGIEVETEAKNLLHQGWHHVMATYDGSGQAAGVIVSVDGQRQPLTIKLDSITAKGTRLSIDSGDAPLLVGRLGAGEGLPGGQIDELCFYDRQLSQAETVCAMLAGSVTTILALPAEGRSPEQVEQLRKYYLHRFDPKYVEMTAAEEALRVEEKDLRASLPTTLVFREREKPREAFVLKRGDYDKRGEKVERATPAALPALAAGIPPNRLDFARWLVERRNPLTARVAVNRIWSQFFGAGLVESADNFGSQGSVPSHPELLDWLAVRFIEGGWDVKGLVRSIVMSNTYRQSSRLTEPLVARDPANRLLARGPRYRLDAEMLRDQALAVGGLLVNRLGGPSVKPPQPDGIWFAVGYSGSNTVRFKADTESDQVHRRTLYTFIKRTAPPPQLNIFDAPSRESCTMVRERTNTPLQALLMLNDPQYIEAARGLAQRVLHEAGQEPAAAAGRMLRICTGRGAEDSQVEELVRLYHDHYQKFQQEGEAAKSLLAVGTHPIDAQVEPNQLAAWTMVANLMLNLDEVVTKN